MARYADAIQWMADNDDTEWVHHPRNSAMGTISVTGALVADLFNKTELQVHQDLWRRVRRTNTEAP